MADKYIYVDEETGAYDDGCSYDGVSSYDGSGLVVNGTESISANASLSLSETATGIDTTSESAQFLLTEAGAGIDTLLPLLIKIITSDSLVGTDTIAKIAASLSISETGSATETLNNLAKLLLGETATAQEIISILASTSIADTAVGQDFIQQITIALIQELPYPSGFYDDTDYYDGESAYDEFPTNIGFDNVVNVLARLILEEGGVSIDEVKTRLAEKLIRLLLTVDKPEINSIIKAKSEVGSTVSPKADVSSYTKLKPEINSVENLKPVL